MQSEYADDDADDDDDNHDEDDNNYVGYKLGGIRRLSDRVDARHIYSRLYI